MKYVRFGALNQEKPGIVGADGKIRDISGLIDDIDPAAIVEGRIQAALKAVDVGTLPLVPDGVRIGACVPKVGNFLAIGLNYAEHATETDAEIPSEPIIFNKAASCVCGPYDDVRLPKGSVKSDWEVELAFVIGKRAWDVGEEDALNHVAGFMICNDVSEREQQLEHGGQWVKGKCYPTFGPLGPWLVTPDEIPDLQNLSLWLDVNGERLQNASTKTMIFSVRHIISYVSQRMVLEPGDVIATGTPPGVGLGMKPERYLKPGDVMRLSVEGLGVQEQKVVQG